MADDEKDLQPKVEEVLAVEVTEEQPQKAEDQPKVKEPSALQRMKEQISEDDDAPVSSLSLRQIVGGDYLFTLVRHHVMLILLVVIITTVYIGFRYQCQQDVIEINRLEGELAKAKYKAMSSSSDLTEMCRQSNVLRLNQDTLLKISDQPPFIIEVPEE
ncbi:MAG: hypothetical protein K2O54_01030 [Prevotella sp.]|nr:hypothetical protein [Prevotella sp.]MDE6011722.1 hypothetical protein [Prevotella sp.]MDE7088681.1 hypothetical protein [Prevotella sp.]